MFQNHVHSLSETGFLFLFSSVSILILPDFSCSLTSLSLKYDCIKVPLKKFERIKNETQILPCIFLLFHGVFYAGSFTGSSK